MNRRFAGALGIVVVVGFGFAISARGVLARANSVLQELAISDSEAQDSFFNALWEGSAYVPGGQKVFRAAAADRKAALVRGVGTVLKAYTRTPAFRSRYADYREANQPRPPDPSPTMESQNEEADRALREMEDNLKNMSPEMRKQMEETLKQVRAQQEAMRKDAKMQAAIADAFTRQEAQNKAQYEKRLKEYAEEHPKDPDAMIARRLREFLDVSATVRFDAPLVKRGALMRFEEPGDENESPEWKLCYRAGRDATAAARAFAAEWLKELGTKGT